MKLEELKKLSKLIRYWILKMTTEAGSGHPTSSLSAVELMVGLMFGNIFKFQVANCKFENNDRLIFSKGHASPLFYSLWTAVRAIHDPLQKNLRSNISTTVGAIHELPLHKNILSGLPTENELMSLRKFGSRLEGHPTMKFPYTEVVTGSLGQGLSVGVGMSLNAKLDNLSYKTFVLLGDSEMAEGSNWEAIQLAKYYKLDNLIGIIDVNRLGQRGETMYGYDVVAYKRRLKAFGWKTFVVNGHDLKAIQDVYKSAMKIQKKPTMIIAKTVKGKGFSEWENKNGWHGKILNEKGLKRALKELGKVDTEIRGVISKPGSLCRSDKPAKQPSEWSGRNQGKIYGIATSRASCNPRNDTLAEDYSKPVATRKAYGHALVQIGEENSKIVVLDAEMSNSTYAIEFKKRFPKRFFEMFIAEQNMVGVAVGLARMGKIPFVSTFASFFTRAVDQIRISQYSQSCINFVGSHVGVSMGEDGPTQMGLEDIAIFRAILGSTVLYASDHISEEKLVKEMVEHPGICYMRTTRMDLPSLYSPEKEFKIGGSQTLRKSKKDQVTLIGAGITLHEALRASEILLKEGILARVIDLYSIKPLDVGTLRKAAKETQTIVVVEDHYAEGGIGEAVASALTKENVQVHSLAVRKMPRSGKPEELLAYEEIDAVAIVRKVKEVISNSYFPNKTLPLL